MIFKALPRLITLRLIAFVAAALLTSAGTKAQTVTFTGKDVALKDIFTAIKTQTGYVVLYDYDLLKDSKPVTVTANRQPLQDFLSDVLKGQMLNFSIRSKTIFIKKSSPTSDNAAAATPPNEQKPIRGIVSSAVGELLAGANIGIKGTRRGVAAGPDGTFTIDASVGDVLLVSSVGYQSVEYTITPPWDQIVVISMKRSAYALGEVEVSVNTGYQRIRPEQSTGAVSTITTKEYESQISTDFLDGLVNRLPGLTINNSVLFNTTDVNNNLTTRSLFNIRGISTMSANSNPLIVVDGYPTELTLDMIDPNEIKSVTILKDAAAATIYGVRASNGVIVIERKQATAGRTRFSFRTTEGITPRENYSRYRWAPDASTIVTNYTRDRFASSINPGTWSQLSQQGPYSELGYPTPFYTMAQQAAGAITPSQAAQSYAALENYNNARDYSRLFLRNALTQTYNLDISGGTADALYYITGNYTGAGTGQINNSNNRVLLSGRTTVKLARRLSMELTTDYQEQHTSSAPVPDISTIYPFEHFKDVNGNPLPVADALQSSNTNPYYNNTLMSLGLEDNLYYPLVDVNAISNKNHIVNDRITGKFVYTIGAGFDLNFGGIYETSRNDNQYYASEQSSVARQYINSYVTQNANGTLDFNIPKGGYLYQETDNTSSYTGRAQLNYNKKIGSDHSVNAILGVEIRDVTTSGKIATYFGYNDQTLLQQPVDYYDIVNGSIVGTFINTRSLQNNYTSYFNQLYTEDRYLSGYSNVVYSFRNTYSLTGSARIDQSNLFGTNPKYKYKPLWTLGAAWNIHKERFMQNVTWVKQLKLRVSDGINGNVAKLSLPQVIARSLLNPYTYPASPSLQVLSYANRSLRWEQTNSFNAGLDYQLFKGISGSIDYYKRKSTDLMAYSQIDPTFGTSPSLINNATIRNNGVEVSLHADWIAKKTFNWNTGLAAARNTSKVLQVYQYVRFAPQNLNAVGFLQGYPVSPLFAYRYAGLDHATGLPIVGNAKGTTYNTQNTTVNGIDPATVTQLMTSDTSGLVRYMGSSLPTITLGLSNRVDIGDFYVYCMLNYYGGFKTIVPRPAPSVARPLKGAGSYWKQPGDEATTDVMALPGFSGENSNANDAYYYADKYVVNAAYITLSDVTLSYSLDRTKFIKRTGFTHFEVKGQVSNLWTTGLNKYNYSMATMSYAKSYLTPTYTIGIFTNF